MSTQSPGPCGAKFVVRTSLTVAGVLGAVALALVWIVIWTLTTRLLDTSVGALAIFAVVLLFLVPVLLFVASSNRPVVLPGERSRFLTWWYSISVALEGISIGVVVVAGYQTQPWLWVPVSAVTMGTVFLAAAVFLSRIVRPASEPVAMDEAGQPIVAPWFPPAKRPLPKVLLMVLWLLVAAAILTWLILQPWQSQGHGVLQRGFPAFLVLFAASMAAIVGSVILGFRAMPLMNRLQQAVPRGTPSRRRIAGAVSRTHVGSLSPAELELARRFALELSVVLPWSLMQFALLYAGLTLNQLGEVLQPSWPFGPWVLVLIVVLFAGALCSLGIRLRLVRRFLRINGEPTPSQQPSG